MIAVILRFLKGIWDFGHFDLVGICKLIFLKPEH